MGLKEKFYFASPVFIQNIAISLMGWRLRRERYGEFYQKRLEELLASQHWSASALLNYQEGELLSLIKYARDNCQHYRSAWRGIEVNSLADIGKLPFVTKEILRREYVNFLDQNLSNRRIHYTNTSGTTGTPMRIPFYPEGRQANYSFFERAKVWAGLNSSSRGATFAGRVFIEPGSNRPPFWRHNYFNNNLQLSSYHLAPDNLRHYYQAIKAFAPEFLDSYPSSVYVLAKFILDRGLEPIPVKAVITSAETLLEHQRTAIEAAFCTRVYDQYGNAEQAAFICQCEVGSYHLNPEFGIVEFINPETGAAVAKGEPGELVCTGFTNRALPLIRYRIGDNAVLSGKLCTCGRQSPVIERLIGRMDDLIVARDGTTFGRLDPVFKGLSESIVEAQIVQISPDEIILKIVRGSNYELAQGELIKEELCKRTGNKFGIRIEFPEAIPRTANGKFRSVISSVR